MTTTTDVAVSEPATLTREATAVQLVTELRERLHQGARDGRLTDEFANGIASGLVSANVVLDPTRHLIMFAREIEAAAAKRRTNPQQDWDNPMGQHDVPSSAEVTLTKCEDKYAARLADDLVSGPWPVV